MFCVGNSCMLPDQGMQSLEKGELFFSIQNFQIPANPTPFDIIFDPTAITAGKIIYVNLPTFETLGAIVDTQWFLGATANNDGTLVNFFNHNNDVGSPIADTIMRFNPTGIVAPPLTFASQAILSTSGPAGSGSPGTAQIDFPFRISRTQKYLIRFIQQGATPITLQYYITIEERNVS